MPEKVGAGPDQDPATSKPTITTIATEDGDPIVGDLLEQHLAMLKESGITQERAAERGYRSVTSLDRQELRGLGFSERVANRVPGLRIPLLGPNGNVWGHQFRPDSTIRPDTGAVVKYETPHGQPNGLDIPPGVNDDLGNPNEPLWITEGSKKADCAVAHGLCCISVSGVWNWRGRNRMGGKVAVSDWQDVALNGREVIIAYDGDVARKKQVRQAMGELAAYLQTKGALVSTVWLPDTDDKTGLDDYLVAGPTVDELRQLVRPFDSHLDGAPGEAKKSVATQLIELARNAFTLGVTKTEDAFGVETGSHVAMMLRNGKTGLRAELTRRYFAQHNTAAPQQALSDACLALEWFAAQENPSKVYLRVAEDSGAVYVDMGDKAAHVIRIQNGTWTMATTAPVLFRRTKLTASMPTPVAGGDLSRLWEFAPIEEEDRPLVLAWLVSAIIQPDVPHPILGMLAEQGSAKTSTTRCLVSLVDPSPVPTRKVPRDAEGWVRAANASWVVALDNLSGPISMWLSDSLCRAATGDGDVRRQLYTDGDMSVIAFRRAIIFNGIDVVVSQGDLADRLLLLHLIYTLMDDPRIDLVTDCGDIEFAFVGLPLGVTPELWAKMRPETQQALLNYVSQIR